MTKSIKEKSDGLLSVLKKVCSPMWTKLRATQEDWCNLIVDLIHKGYARRRHTDRRAELLHLPVDILVPIAAQRDVTPGTIKKNLEAGQGYDEIAEGIIQVARVLQNDGSTVFKVWDGSHRLVAKQAVSDAMKARGEIDEPLTIRCWVTDMSEEDASYYFAYTQKTARRNLCAEETFVNGVVAGNQDHLYQEAKLETLGLRVDGASDFCVPTKLNKYRNKSGMLPPSVSKAHPSIKLRTLDLMNTYSRGDTAIQKQAVDLIKTVWPDEVTVHQGMCAGLCIFLRAFESEVSKNGSKKLFESFMSSKSSTKPSGQGSTWKKLGNDVKNREPESVAYGVLKDLHTFGQCTPHYERNVFSVDRLKDYCIEHHKYDPVMGIPVKQKETEQEKMSS